MQCRQFALVDRCRRRKSAACSPWQTGADTGPAKDPVVELELTATPAPFTSPASEPTPAPIKVREEARKAPLPKGDPKDSSWLLSAAPGVAVLPAGEVLSWSRNRPSVDLPALELCPGYRAPRQASPSRRRAHETVADARTPEDLAGLECQ